MDLEFNTEQKQVSAVFKQYRNTIDVYTEDKIEDKAFYVNLLKRLTCDTDIEINDVTPLGNKENVIKACKADTDNSRPKIYIVDGDVYLQYQEEEPINHLFRLNAYCIENYVICEDAICNAAYDLNGGRCTKEEIRTKVDFNQTLQSNLALINLFFLYSVQVELCKQFHLWHFDSFCNNEKTSVDEGKINNRLDEIKKELISSGYSEEEIDLLTQKRQQKFNFSEETLLTIVSGKDYLVPLFSHIINNKIGGGKIQLPKESWKFQFAKTCNLERLSDLKDAIIKAC